MITGIKFFNKSVDKEIIAIYTILGIAVFYFILHPFTMVLYWFEFKNEPITFSSFIEVLGHRFKHSFSFKMLYMSLFFIVMGGVFGAAAGVFKVRTKKLSKHIDFLKKDISNLIQQGENQFLEFKSSIRYDFNLKTTNIELEMVIAKTLVGFMNSKGGKLIIGVSDEGNIIGIENDFITLKQKNSDGFEQKVYEIISKYIGKEYCSLVNLYFYPINNKNLCVLDIQKTNEPAYLLKGRETIFYLRTGNATRPLSIKEAVHYMNMEKDV
tara:strand:+ start:2791 stop:3594 length:804 start_codon:yes stop_codon:yes gene_type:complete